MSRGTVRAGGSPVDYSAQDVEARGASERHVDVAPVGARRQHDIQMLAEAALCHERVPELSDRQERLAKGGHAISYHLLWLY
eukprot:2215010-Pleurochrysis_carterae.AAC.1